MARKNNSDDFTMHATVLGKRVGDKMDEDQPKLPSKKKYRFLRRMAGPFLNWWRMTISLARHNELPSLELL